MALEVIDIRYGEAKKNLHDLILIILAKEYPLKIGEIAQRLRKQFRVILTFQAVRKSLNMLTERKILDVSEKAYTINKNFILESKRLSDQLMENYFGGAVENRSLPTSSKEESHTSYHFENLIKADQFWSEVVLDWAYNLKEGDDRTFCFHGPHCWYVFGHLGLESTFHMELKAHRVKAYDLVEQDTLLDRWAADFYEKHNATYLINPNPTGMRTAIGVFGDFVIQYDYPEELYEKIEGFYNQAKDLKTTDITLIAQLLKFKTDINLIVMRNKIVAAKIKEGILGKFKAHSARSRRA